MRRERAFAILPVVVLVALALVVSLVFVYNSKKAPGKTPGLSQARNLVAIGASTTKANNLSSSLIGDHPEYSFATGTKIDSVYQYLKSKGEDIVPRNLAESGAESAKALTQQVPNAASYEPKYVLIDIVADLFFEDNPAKLKQNLTEIVQKLKKSDTTILIGTYPNLFAMRKAGFASCSQDKLGIGIEKVTEEKLKLFNQAIVQVANENGIILVDNFNTLGPGDVSDYDCLHPNIEGQKKLAKSWISVLEKGR